MAVVPEQRDGRLQLVPGRPGTHTRFRASASGGPATPEYTPRDAAGTIVYRIVADRLETFLDRECSRGRPAPPFVEREFRRFLECGIHAHGFLRVHCDACGHDRVVPFSCKGRGFCPSCGGRRMADTAAHLVDRVLPAVPVRQWVLTLPFPLRFRMAHDTRVTTAILRIYVRRLFAGLRRRARKRLRIDDPRCGAVTFIQRFGGALNLNVHFHTLALDGAFDPDDALRFHLLPPPDDDEVASVLRATARGILRLLERNHDAGEPIDDDGRLVAALRAASVHGRIATGPRTGQEVMRFGDRIDPDHLGDTPSPRCARVEGMSLHADVAVPARDRARLERLCRYVARPPVAQERLSLLPDGRVLYALRHRWRDGTTHVGFLPLEFVEKLAALVPAPRFNLVRYHGILAPAARHRAEVIPKAKADDAVVGVSHEDGEAAQRAPRSRNYTWAELMRRVFAVDVLECPDCRGRMRILAAIHSLSAIRAILECLGLPARPPPITPADPDPGRPELDHVC